MTGLQTIDQQIDYLLHPIDAQHNYVHRWRRDLIAQLLRAYIDDIKYKERLREENEQVVAFIRQQLEKEIKEAEELRREFEKNQQKLIKVTVSIQQILNNICKFLKKKKKKFFPYLRRCGWKISYEEFKSLMKKLNWESLAQLLYERIPEQEEKPKTEEEEKKPKTEEEKKSKTEEEKKPEVKSEDKELQNFISCVLQQIEYLEHPIDAQHNYVHRWRRNYIAQLLRAYKDDIEFKERLRSEYKMNKEVEDSILSQLKQEEERIKELNRKYEEEKAINQSFMKLLEYIIKFLRKYKDSFYTFLAKSGVDIDIEVYDYLMDSQELFVDSFIEIFCALMDNQNL
jgi:hypothetical protein